MLDKTVDFDDENSWEDFGIVFETMTIGSAEPQLVLIDVPFRNGSLDETDYFGDVRYKDRTITMGFLIPWWSEDQHGIFSEVQNRLNGQRKRITFSADQDWYYEGRLKVGDFKIDNGFFKFDITATADPYKYSDVMKRYEMVKDEPFEVVLNGDYMKEIPAFTTNVPIQVQFEENLYSFSAGTHKNAGIVLKEGKNFLTITAMDDSIEEVSENLLTPPYYGFDDETVKTINGVTFTLNEDNTISAVGTLPANKNAILTLKNTEFIDNFHDYYKIVLSGSPSYDTDLYAIEVSSESSESAGLPPNWVLDHMSTSSEPVEEEITSDTIPANRALLGSGNWNGNTEVEVDATFTPSLIGYKNVPIDPVLTINYRQGRL